MNTPRPPAASAAGPGSDWGWTERPDDPPSVGEPDRYVAVGLVGAGGMSRVEAVRDRVLDREVARKVASPELDPALADAVLRHEARVVARLEHPNIVPVHDAGRLPDGRRFLTMRLVRGRTLADVHRDDRGPGRTRRALRRLLDVCRALAHAHARGVVHADLKPDNVLVGPNGDVQVADWGLARFLDDAEGRSPIGSGAGTPPWRAPEVAFGEPPDPRSDVYALGVMLRDVLAELGDRAPRDLRAVAERATADLPGERYADAGALGQEIERWLDDQPVEAHTYTATELLARFVRAWRVPLVVAGFAAMTLAVVVALAAARTAAERDRAVAAEDRLARTAAALWSDRAVAALLVDDREEAVRAAREALALGPSPAAAGVLAALATPAPAGPIGAPVRLACDRVVHVAADGVLCERDGALHHVGLDGGRRASVVGEVSDAIFEASGSWLIVGGDRLMRVDPATGERVTLRDGATSPGLIAGSPAAYVDRLAVAFVDAPDVAAAPCPASATLDTVALAPDGRWWGVCSTGLVVAGARGAGAVPLAEVGDRLGPVVAAAWDAAGGRVLVGTLRGRVAVLETADGALHDAVDTGLRTIRRIVPSPDGLLALVIDDRGAALLWRPADGAMLGRLVDRGVAGGVWADERRFDLVGGDVVTWEVAPGAAPYRWLEPGGISAIAVSPGGDAVAVAAGPVLSVRRLPDGALRWRSDAHDRVIKALAFSSDGAWLLSGAVDEPDGLRLAAVATGARRALPEGLAKVRSAAFLSDGGVAAATWSTRLARWSSVDAAPSTHTYDRVVVQVVPLPDGGLLVLDEGGALWRDGDPPAPIAALPDARRLAISADGRRIATLGVGVAVLHAPFDGSPWRVPVGADASAIALSSAGDRLLVGHRDGTVALWEVGAPSPRWSVRAHAERVSAVAALPDGGWLSAGWDGAVRRWGADPTP